MASEFRAGYVAIVGKPNVGKSTLLNVLINYRLSAISPKPQTTRHKILGILNGDNYQAVFIDTPGVLKPRYELHRFMQKEIEEAVDTADLSVVVVEPFHEPQAEEVSIIEQVKALPKILAINKIDLIEKPLLLPLIDKYRAYNFLEIHPISALKGSGIDELKSSIVKNLPTGEPFYPQNQITEKPERFFVEELIREGIFHRYGEEIPYSCAVEVEEFQERPEGQKDYIRAVIYVEKPSQRAILLGKNGEAIKRLGKLARENIEKLLGRPVYLELFVKVKPDWRDDKRFIKDTVYRYD
ncbi:MAG: GTPase Era [candidate division WOR-3 bacterium]